MKLAVIMPVYGDFRLTSACLDSVIESRAMNSNEFRLLVIYDCSGDKDIEQYLDQLAKNDLIELSINPANLGFVKTVNRGFSQAADADCIILNSDTLVHGDWVDRFVSVAGIDPSIGTITPFTNNGEICSFPEICKDNPIPEFSSFEELDSAFSCNANEAILDIPTGVGFCMYVRRQALDRLGFFDEEAFGKGYGEENDLCVRFSRQGYRNVLAPQIFVYHAGGVSFGEKKRQLVENAIATINARYPDYSASVSSFIQNDLPKYTRFKTIVRLMSESAKPSILIVSHGMGGGTERYISELNSFFQGEANFFNLIPGVSGRLHLDFPGWSGLGRFTFNSADDYSDFLSLLQSISFNLIHVNHTKGYEALVSRMIDELDVPYILTLHDYYLISGNPVLTDSSGFHNENIAIDNNLREKDFDRHVNFCSYKDWLSYSEELIVGAAKVIAPCSSVINIFQKLYPEANFEEVPHLDFQEDSLYPDVSVKPSGNHAVKKVVVLGALSKEKGADILEQVADLAKAKKFEIEFHLVGYAYRRLSSNVIVTGSYNDDELLKMLSDISPDIIWFPSRWAETYSYTLSAAFLSGCPVMIPEFGAQYVRSLGRPQTSVFNTYDPESLLDKIKESLLSLELHQGRSLCWKQERNYSFSYKRNYLELALSGSGDNSRVISDELAVSCMDRYGIPEPSDKYRKKLLKILLKARMSRVGALLSRSVPLSLQKKIKRKLFRSSVHEL